MSNRRFFNMYIFEYLKSGTAMENVNSLNLKINILKMVLTIYAVAYFIFC